MIIISKTMRFIITGNTVSKQWAELYVYFVFIIDLGKLIRMERKLYPKAKMYSSMCMYRFYLKNDID